MSDHDDLYLNEFFSAFHLPEDLEPQPHEHPNSYVPSDIFDYFAPFPEADLDVFMSESQDLASAPHDPASLVDDGANIVFSACEDPSVSAYELIFSLFC